MAPHIALIITDYERKHLNNQRKIALIIKRLYEAAIDEVTTLASLQSLPAGQFQLRKLPGLNKLINEVVAKMGTDVEAVLRNGIADAWQLSNDKNDAIFDIRLKGSSIPDVTKAIFYDANLPALQQFQARARAGMKLSSKVWKDQFKSELEASLGEGISVGKSATKMASDAKGFLEHPDKLFRRVRNAKGKLVLSKNAKAFNPGQGVYRSSYKNVLRVTGTETNMAYRTSDMAKYASNPLVIGFEVKLSNNHPKLDVCDFLAGNYPTTFKFVGWHPNCLCFEIPILMNDVQFAKYEDLILSGRDSSGNIDKMLGKSKVIEPHSGFDTWIKDNSERLSRLKSEPYFIRDNKGFIAK